MAERPEHAAMITSLQWAAAANDPTGLSSPVGRWVVLAGLVAALVVLILQWRRRR
jgi:hypothetical protein